MAPPSWAFQRENFELSPHEDLICSICQMVFCEPTECPCKHVFCNACIKKWVGIHESCPICRKRTLESSLYSANRIINNLIMSMKIRCVNFMLGCDAPITVESSELHIKACQYEMLQCPNECGATFYRKELGHHEAENCPYRICKVCGLKIGTNQIRTDKIEHDCIQSMRSALDNIKKTNCELEEKVEKMREALYQMRQFVMEIFVEDRPGRGETQPVPPQNLEPQENCIPLYMPPEFPTSEVESLENSSSAGSTPSDFDVDASEDEENEETMNDLVSMSRQPTPVPNSTFSMSNSISVTTGSNTTSFMASAQRVLKRALREKYCSAKVPRMSSTDYAATTTTETSNFQRIPETTCSLSLSAVIRPNVHGTCIPETSATNIFSSSTDVSTGSTTVTDVPSTSSGEHTLNYPFPWLLRAVSPDRPSTPSFSSSDSDYRPRAPTFSDDDSDLDSIDDSGSLI